VSRGKPVAKFDSEGPEPSRAKRFPEAVGYLLHPSVAMSEMSRKITNDSPADFR
jgi:hypothetical protein